MPQNAPSRSGGARRGEGLDIKWNYLRGKLLSGWAMDEIFPHGEQFLSTFARRGQVN